MPDRVSWYLIEKGWTVVSAEGEQLGQVVTVDGEISLDIFDGIEYRHAVHERVLYVPSESIGDIYVGEIHLTVSQGEIR